jgi:hypothetical protein
MIAPAGSSVGNAATKVTATAAKPAFAGSHLTDQSVGAGRLNPRCGG